MSSWHSLELHAVEMARERLAEAEHQRLLRLAREAQPPRPRPPVTLAWPRQVVWQVGSALVVIGQRLISAAAGSVASAAETYPLPPRQWSPSTKSYAGG